MPTHEQHIKSGPQLFREDSSRHVCWIAYHANVSITGYVAVSRLVILDTRTMHVDISRASGASQAGPGGLPAAAQPRWPPPQGVLLPVVAATEPCRPPLGGGLSAAVAEGPPRRSAGPHCRTTLPSSWPASLAAEHSPAAPATAQITALTHGNEIPAQFGEHPRGGAKLRRALI